MNTCNPPITFGGLPSPIRTLLLAVVLSSLAGTVSAASIGMQFVRGAGADVTGVQDAVNNSLLPTDLAGASAYAQVNWNNLGARGTNIVLRDGLGASSGVTIDWDAANAWSQGGGGTPAVQGSPDGNLMNGYLDSNNTANGALNPNLWANGNGNKPLVYLSGLAAWMTAQGVASYDVVIYSDGDATAGRVGEYWLLNASGPASSLTLGNDLTTHTFICDRANFISAFAYDEVPATVLGGQLSQRGNFQGNHTVFNSLTNDSFLIQTAEFNTRSPINAIQIIPRATPLPALIDPLPAAPKVFPGGTARLRASVAGVVPFSYRWQKNGVGLTDGGNVSGATTATLTLANVSASDVASYSLVVTNPNGVVTSTVASLTLEAPLANSFAATIVAKQPAAYWRFNETEDPATNYSAAYDFVGGFSGIYGNAALNGATAVAGPQPTEFPGFEAGNLALQSARNLARSWIVAPPLALNTNTVTICGWIYPTTFQTANTAIFSARNTGTDIQTFGFANNGNNNTIGYTWNNQNFNFISGLVPLTNAWSFVALVVTPSNAVLYCYNTNGQFSATNAVAHTNAPFNGLVTIGTDPSNVTTPADRAFSGTIDELAVFNRSLDPAEILDLYKKGLGVTGIPPVIPVQPKSLALMAGRTANFSVLASGDTPLSYQWRRNGGNMAGATNPSLSRSNVTPAGDAGEYDVVVNNPAGSLTSSVVTLSVVASNSFPVPYEAKLREFNPIAYWRLGETNGSPYAYDYWGGNLAANLNVVSEVPGPQPPAFTGIEATNTAAQYDGLSAETASAESLMNNRAQFSIIGWFNTAGPIGARVGLFGQNDVCEFGFHANGPDGLPQIGIWTPRGAAFLNQTNIQPGVWYLVAAIGDGTNVSLRLVSTNGGGGFQVLQANTTHAATTNYGSSTFPFRFSGGVIDNTGGFFTGLIDEVAVFNRPLSVGELSDLFGAALLGGALPPGIAASPASVTLYAGRTATFQVSAVGTSPFYQWRSNGVPISNGGNVFGVRTDTLVITNVSAANQAAYDVIVTNGVGAATSSPPATLTVITPTPGSFEAAVIAANPIAYYRFNETDDPSTGSLPAYDFWGGGVGTYGAAAWNAFNAVLGPTPTDGFNVFESTNGAVQTFNAAANAYVTAPALGITTDTITMTAWINPISHHDRAGIIFVRAGQPATGLNFIGTGNLNYHWLDTAATYSWDSGLNVPLNQWSFVALVVQPTQATIYLINANGTQSAVNAVTHASRAFTDTIRIGGDPNADTRTFNGRIDEVAFFNYALTPAEIQGLYLAAPAVTLSVARSGANLILTWPQGTLLEANAVTGPYTTNNATSPYQVTPTGASKFYRVIVK